MSMRKVLGGIVLSGICTVLHAVPADPGFEKNNSWKFVNGEIREKAGVGDSRAFVAKRTGAKDTDGKAWQFIRVKAGNSYKLSYMARAVITQKGKYKVGAGSILIFHGKGKVISRKYNNGLCATSGNWVKQEYFFTVPAECSNCELQLGLFNGYCGEAFFDDVNVEEISEN